MQDQSRHDCPTSFGISIVISKAEFILVFINLIRGGTFAGPIVFVGLRFAAAAIVSDRLHTGKVFIHSNQANR